ncbi:MAG: response regulator [Nanoarchaeota archaeon]|nr:response regulator [Nanoarchaeota archaeon]
MKGPILLVEDSHLNSRLWELVLSRNDYLVLSYDDGQKVITDIEDGLQYKLALVDLELPNRGGDEVIKVSKEYNPQIPIYCVSGYLFKPPLATGHIWRGDLNSERLLGIINSHLK